MLDYMPNIVYNVAGTLSNKVYILFTWLGELQSYWNSELRSSDVSWTSSMTSTTFVWTRRSEQIKSIQMMLLAKIWTILIYNPHTDMIVGHVKHTHTVFNVSCGRRYGEFRRSPLDTVRTRLGSITYPKLSFWFWGLSATERFEWEPLSEAAAGGVAIVVCGLCFFRVWHTLVSIWSAEDLDPL